MRHACTVSELRAAGGALGVSLGSREVLIAFADAGIYAVDRLCPHEAYPLDRGRIERGELTCPAHGWRFDLATGACRTATDDLRSYDVEVRDGTVFVNVDVEPTTAELERGGEAVIGALEVGRPSLAARRTARLLGIGSSPERVLLLLARYGASHAEAGLDPETAAVADVLVLLPHLDGTGTVRLVADLAAAMAERLARAAPRFGPEPAAPLAWSVEGVEMTLSRLVAAGDADECEAVVAGMVAAGVPPAAIGAGLAAGAAATFRGPWPLVVLRRAVALVEAFGPEAAGVALPVAAYGCATPWEGPGSFARTAGALADRPAAVADTLRGSAEVLAGLAPRDDAGAEGTRSLLGCALAVVHADAAAWAVDQAGEVARPAAVHAATLAAIYGAGRAATTGPDPTDADLAGAVAAGSAQTPRGLAVALAVAAVAISSDDRVVRTAVARFLTMPRRERFTVRDLAPEFISL